MAIHVAYIKPVLVDKVGNIIDKNDPETPISAVTSASSEMRIMPDGDIPSSADYPTIKNYLIAEDAAGLSLKHIDNNLIITQS